MFIQAIDTPNPNTIKFIPGIEIAPSGSSYFFRSEDIAQCSHSLALNLFKTEFIESVFISSEFVSITKNQDFLWEEIKSEILEIIADYCVNVDKDNLVSSLADHHDSPINDNCEYLESDSETVEKITALIDSKVRPALEKDGGNIVFRGYQDKVVYVSLQGSCVGCPSSNVTLKHGIESLLQYYFPDYVERIISIPYDIASIAEYLNTIEQ